MVDRRRFVMLSAASMAGTLVGVPSWATGASRNSGQRVLRRAIYDERFPESLAFAREMGSRGVRASGLLGDVAGLWYKDLQGLLRQTPGPISGLTDRATLFCLEELSRDVGMKVAVRVDHSIAGNGAVEHQAVGPARWVNAIRDQRLGQNFGPTMAALLDEHANTSGHMAAQKRTGPFSSADHTALVSWIIV